MKLTLTSLTLVAMIADSGVAQQVNPPQPTQPVPCIAAVAPKAPKGWHLAVPPKLQQAIDKQRQQLTGKAGITTPSPEELKKQIEQPKPCLAAPTPTTTNHNSELRARGARGVARHSED